MIWLPIYYPISPVHLLQQDHPHQLMGKGHFREAECIIRPLQHIFSQTNGSADHESNTALPLYAERLDLFCKFFGGKHLSSDFQCDHIHVVPDVLQDAFTFFAADLFFQCLACLIRCFLI